MDKNGDGDITPPRVPRHRRSIQENRYQQGRLHRIEGSRSREEDGHDREEVIDVV
jgi:hypothetical protein